MSIVHENFNVYEKYIFYFCIHCLNHDISTIEIYFLNKPYGQYFMRFQCIRKIYFLFLYTLSELFYYIVGMIFIESVIFFVIYELICAYD
ncbi:hypothetical protein BMW23_0290 [Bodo saltans virus]|uniref:Transmembrane protein n=1 Tax=Bodo saltans virus TaxID=2024608 RepID=A0A2H4UTX8_9VIRU|nr:hypothetical protein QJ851_gp0285 [Bodo saltans virus]ATZ80348.1 hypothetical protein BMW23_0290 [Bodo saltans virus]